jgi:hypothetical protein
MTTRAANIQFLLSGLSSTTTGHPVESGTVYFYEAGTTTPKYVWTEIAKTNGYYNYTLDAVGAAQLYGEGNYKVVVKDASGATVATLDNIRLEFPYYGIRTITETSAQVSQDDFILVNTSGGAVLINCLPAASWTRPLKIQRISGSNNISVYPNGSETIDGSSPLTITSDAIVEIISDGSNLRSAGFRSSFADGDNDTKIQVEEGADDDTIRFDTAGVERVVIDSSGLDIKSGDLLLAGSTAFDTTNPPLLGNNVYNVIRSAGLYIVDGTNASTLKCTFGAYGYNYDTIAETDNVTGTVGDFTYDTNNTLTVESSGLSGNCVGVISASIAFNNTGTPLIVYAYPLSNGIVMDFYNGSTGASVTLDTLVDSGNIRAYVTYVTDA